MSAELPAAPSERGEIMRRPFTRLGRRMRESLPTVVEQTAEARAQADRWNADAPWLEGLVPSLRWWIQVDMKRYPRTTGLARLAGVSRHHLRRLAGIRRDWRVVAFRAGNARRTARMIRREMARWLAEVAAGDWFVLGLVGIVLLFFILLILLSV